MRVVHLTDLHLVEPGGRRFGLDPLARLDAALAHIARHEAGADALLLTGDLTDQGADAAYAALRERLAGMSPRPVLILGNHDHRDRFKAAFSAAPVDPAGFVQTVLDDASGVSLVTLDTYVAGTDAGELCTTRLAWLADMLAMRKDRAVYLAMHHPPVDCGIPGMDAIGLRDAAAFWDVLDRFRTVRHVFAGHIHRPFFARRGDVTVSTLPGTSHQVHLQFQAPDVVLGSLEPGAYGIAELATDGFAIHVRVFADDAPRFVFNAASNAATTPTALTRVPEAYRHLL